MSEDRYITLGDTLNIHFPYRSELVQAIKRVDGATFNTRGKYWSIPLEFFSIQSLKGFLLQFPDFTFDIDVKRAIESVEDQANELLRLSSAEDTDYRIDSPEGISEYQNVGVEYISKVHRGYIGDDPGVGKTLQALASITVLDALPSLIIVPAFLKLKWKDEIEEWLPDVKYQVIFSKSDDLDPEAQIVVTNYELLAQGWKSKKQKIVELAPPMEDLKDRIRSIVIDEIHYCKSRSAQRSKAVHKLSRKVDYRIGLSGSPMVNRPEELIYPLQILDRLDDFGGYQNFVNRYCAPEKTQFGLNISGSSNEGELFERLRRNCMVRRTKSQVLKYLEPKRYSNVPVEITNRQEYEYAERELLSWIRDRAMENPDFLETISGLDPDEQENAKFLEGMSAAMRAQAAETLIRINSLKRLTAEGKMDAAKSWISDFLESGQKLVVFAHHKNIVNFIGEAFDVPVITGDVSHKKRYEYQKEFQDGDLQLIPLNIQAGGVGIDLYASSDVLFLEFPWSPSIYDQASDRCHRRGQEDSVTIWNMVGRSTMDTNMVRLLDNKREVIEAVMDNKTSENIFKDFLEEVT